jgi:hypothetical protein
VTRYGYPFKNVSRRLKTGRRVLYMHRIFWAREHGPIPAGYQVDHLCGNARCVNPEHLDAVPVDAHRSRTARRRATQT